MSIEREDYFCGKCNNEIIIDLTINDDISEEDIKFCPFCGAEYNNEMNVEGLDFGDPDDYEE